MSEYGRRLLREVSNDDDDCVVMERNVRRIRKERVVDEEGFVNDDIIF